MSVRIQVNDRSDRPKVGNTVFVKWTDGFSEGQTDGNGVYDTGRSGGTIEYISIYGEQVLGRRRVDSNDYITVVTNK